MRLLQVVLAERPEVSTDSEAIEPALLDRLMSHVSTMAAVYHIAPEQLEQADAPEEPEEPEEPEGPEEKDQESENESNSDSDDEEHDDQHEGH